MIVLTKAYLNLANDLNLVYRVFLPYGYENPTATFVVGGAEYEVSEYTRDENGLYLFKLTQVGPHKMADMVTITVSATLNGETKTVTNDKLSIKKYVESLRAENAEDESLLSLLDTLLVYGATAQVYKNYNTDNLVAEIGEFASIPENLFTVTGESSALANIVSAGLRLDGAFDLRVKILAESYSGLVLVIREGETVTELPLSEGQTVVYYDGLTIRELDTEVTFTLKQNGETVGKTLTFSANAYLYRMQTSENTALANLVKALYAYGVSAKNYAE